MVTLSPGAWRMAAVAVMAATLSSCGGGGGSGSSSSSSSSSSSGGGGSGLTFSPNPTSFAFDYVDTAQRPSQFIVVTAQGTLPASLYIGAQDQSSHLDPQITVSLSGNQGTFEIKPNLTLAPGNFTGTLRLLGCSDSGCSRHLGNSPISVPYTIRVRPGFRVRPEPHDPVTYTSGGQGSADYTIQLPENVTTSEVTTINGGGICHIANATPTSFSLVASSAPSGDYLCQYKAEAGTHFTLGSVNFHVLAPAGGNRDLSVAETQLTFTSAEGAPSTPQRLHITPASWESGYDIASNGYGGSFGDWLRFTRAGDGFDVVADASALPQGSYYASVRVSSASPYYSSQVIVPVSVTVGPGLVRPADVIRSIDSESTVANLSGSVPIQLAAGSPLQWNAASGAAWLTLASTTGQTGTPLSFSFNNAAFRALPNGHEHVATITVNTTNPAIAAIAFAVRVNKRIAQVTGLGPYLHISGRPLHAQVRGVGFSSMNNLSRVSVAGLPTATFTLINDTTLEVNTPGNVIAGSYPITVSNSLALPTASRTLKVINPVSFPYAAVDIGRRVGNVIYDAERQRIYVTSQGYEQDPFLCFDRAGATWSATPYPAVAEYDFGLTPDGTRILITEPPSHVRVLDAQTLAPTGEFDYEGSFQATAVTGRQVPITNDGRAWLGMTMYQYNRNVVVFDSNEGTFSRFGLPGTRNFDALTFEVPRNGARLYVGEIFNNYEFVAGVLDAATSGYTQLVPGYSGRMFKMHSSDDGSRLTVGGGDIFNGSMQPYASPYEVLNLAPGWVVAFGLMSPDARRAYVLTYDPTDIYIYNNPPPAPHSKPRIYVVDTSSGTATPGSATILGYFELNDYPICRTQSCDQQTRGAITPDGRNLILAGQDHLVVAPIPAETTLMSRAPPAPLMKLWIPGAAKR